LFEIELDHGRAQKLVDKMSDEHRIAYESLIKILNDNVLCFPQADWAKYTDHSHEHSRRITEHLAKMIPDRALRRMSSLEVFIVLSSAWLHDIGQVWKRLSDQEPRDDSEIRRRHHELGEIWIKNNWQKPFPSLSPAVAERVAEVCFCHRRLVDIKQKFSSKSVYIGTDEVRPRVLSALLRLADAMDTDARRAPELILSIDGLEEESKREWQKCQLVEGVGYDRERNSIVVSSRDIRSDDDEDLFLEKCKDLYGEFYSVKDILFDDSDGDIRYTSMFVRMRPPERERNASELFPNPVPPWKDLFNLAGCATGTVINGMEKTGKYVASIYVRREVETDFREFIASNKTGFAVVGPSGVGKTNLFCHLAESHTKRGDLVLLYNGAFLPSADVESQISKDLGGYCLKQTAELALKENKYFLVLIDGVNDFVDPGILLRYVNDMVRRLDNPRAKIAISCRSVVWNWLFDYDHLALYGMRFFTPKGELETSLPLFEKHELVAAYQAYKKKFELQSELDTLSKETQEMLRDPLMLRVVSETYAGKVIPARISIYDVFDRYYRKKIFDETTGRGDQHVRDFLTDLVAEMRRKKADRIKREHLRHHPKLGQQIDDPTRSSAFTKLKDENILYEIFAQAEVKFVYDRFFEYLLTRMVLSEPFDSKRFLQLTKDAEDFFPLRGAVKTALVLKKRWDIIRDLAAEEDYLVKGIIIEALADLATHDREATVSLMRDLFKSGHTSAKRLVVLAAAQVRAVVTDLLEQAMKDKSPLVRGLAVQTAYLVWMRDHREGERLAEHVATIGLRDLGRPVMQANLELQERIFLNNYKDRDAVLLVDRLGLQRVEAKISAAERMKILDAGIWLTERMFTKLWGWSYDDWVRPLFSISKEYREAAKCLLRYFDPSLRLSQEAQEILYDLAGGPFAGIATLVLIFQMRTYPDAALSVIRRLMMARDDCRIVRGLGSLAFGSRWVDLPKEDLELASKIIYDKRSQRGALCQFGMNFSVHRPGKIEFVASILKKAEAEGKIEVLVDAVSELGNIGIRFPENAFATVEDITDSSRVEAIDALAKAFSRIRVFHPDKVDTFLWSRRRELLGKVTLLELEHVPIEVYAVIEFIEYLFEKMPRMRAIFIEMIDRYIDVRSSSDFRKLLKFCIRRSVDTWLCREFVNEYLRNVQADTGKGLA